MRRLLAAVVILFLLTPMLWMGAYLVHPKAVVGVVLVDQCGEHLGDIAAEAFFEYYDDYFEARVLPVRFNASFVRIKDDNYLNSDFFRLGNVSRLKEKYDVDIILFVTDHSIKDWDGDGRGVWGQANAETGAALMTVRPWMSGLPQSRIRIEHVAVHEIFHLFGYSHNSWDHSGIMQYATNPTEVKLCTFYELQLPVRSITWRLGIGAPFGVLAMFTGLSWALILLPSYIALELLIHEFYKRREGDMTTSKVLIYLSVVQAAVLLTTTGGAFYTLLFPPVFFMFFHHLYYSYYKVRPAGKKRPSD